MLKICLVFCKSEPQYTYKLYAYKKKTCIIDVLRNTGFLIYPPPSCLFGPPVYQIFGKFSTHPPTIWTPSRLLSTKE